MKNTTETSALSLLANDAGRRKRLTLNEPQIYDDPQTW